METRDVAGRCFARIQKCLPILSLCWAGCLPGWMQSRLPLERPQPCVLPENVSKQQLVAHLNHNRQQLRSWRSTDVSIQAVGAGPMRLGASLAVESPRRFRLIAKSLRGVEADLGSNQDRFWYWMRADGTPYIFTAHHRDTDLVQRQLEIPFQPEWLMEALGVVPLDTSRAQLLREESSSDRIQLISNQVTDGRVVQRVMVVDLVLGQVVEHALFDQQSQLICSARMSDFRRPTGDESGTSRLPHRIELNWPRAEMKLTMKMGEIEANPEFSSYTWQVLQDPSCRVVDLDRAWARR